LEREEIEVWLECSSTVASKEKGLSKKKLLATPQIKIIRKSKKLAAN
jgi:hypothetical protein